MIERNAFLTGAVAALGWLLLPLAAAAQDIPSYAVPVQASADETIHGRIASIDGAFNISVNDDRGFIDNVELHAGTIINPTGLSLAPGMSVTIAGFNAGAVFDANEIDTPYSYSGPLPTPVYYGPGYWCPGFDYGYGPSFSLAIIIGGGFHRFEHRPFYGRPWDGHRYFGNYVGRLDGGPRHLLRAGADESRDSRGERRGFSGQRRGFGSGARGASDGVPPAFARRSFAGRPYVAGSVNRTYGVPRGSAYPVRSFTAERSFAQPYARNINSARAAYPAGSGFVRRTPAGSGFARSSGGFARDGGGSFARSTGGAAERGGARR